MDTSTPTIADQIAVTARTLQHQRTGHMPESVTVVLEGRTLVITLHGALSAAEQSLARSSEGLARVQEYHRELFQSSCDLLRQEIGRITGTDVHEASAEIQPKTGAVIHTFTTGTMVQCFQLSDAASGTYAHREEEA